MDGDLESLDNLVTRWSLIAAAHGQVATDAADARRALILHYRVPIQRYVRSLLRGDTAADDLAQTIFLRVMNGEFRNAHPERGRFRDMLKAAVRNLIRTEWRQQSRREKSQGTEVEPFPVIEDAPDDWEDSCRDAILDQVWLRMRSPEHQPALRVLELRSAFPSESSPELAARLATTTGQPCTPESWRQLLRRSRQRFVQLLIEETAARIDDRSLERIEQELVDLNLWETAKAFLPPEWQAARTSPG